MTRGASRLTSSFVIAVTLWLGADDLLAGQFEKAAYYAAGQRPYHVVTAHFTQSGNLDLAVVDYVSNQVCILLGDGNGVFKRSSCLSAFSLPFGIAVGDFNEDGNEDLGIVETGGTGHGDLKIFLGDGKGGFRLSAHYRTGIASCGLTLADFNGDGHLDAAVTDFGFGDSERDVMVFFGDGHGKLGKPVKYPMGTTSPCAIAAGDLNGDHSPDLAVSQFSAGSVAVLLNDGTGHFGKPVSYNVGGASEDVAIADLRHDGRKDLVVANSQLSVVDVLLNKGDGTFETAKTFPPHCYVDAIVVSDFNLDGKLDVAVAASIDNSAFMYGKGDGSFGPPIPIKDAIGTDGGFSIAAGIFNKSRGPSLAIPIQASGKVAIMLNTK